MGNRTGLSMHSRNFGCYKIVRPYVRPYVDVTGHTYYPEVQGIFNLFLLEIGHPCYVQLTAVKICYPTDQCHMKFLSSYWFSIDRWFRSIFSGGFQFASCL